VARPERRERRPAGVHPPEAAFDPRAFVAALAERGLTIEAGEIAG
jgi:hypothetical protein